MLRLLELLRSYGWFKVIYELIEKMSEVYLVFGLRPKKDTMLFNTHIDIYVFNDVDSDYWYAMDAQRECCYLVAKTIEDAMESFGPNRMEYEERLSYKEWRSDEEKDPEYCVVDDYGSEECTTDEDGELDE
jgi:hypothetical protein